MKNFFTSLAIAINKKIQRHIDKVLHFVISYAITLTFTVIAVNHFGAPMAWSMNFGIALALMIGVAKEFFDLYVKKSKFSIGDIVADALGIALAAVLFLWT